MPWEEVQGKREAERRNGDGVGWGRAVLDSAVLVAMKRRLIVCIL